MIHRSAGWYSGAVKPGHAIGRAVKDLRLTKGWTQDALSRRLKERGLDWSRERVAAVEADRREDLTLTELLLLGDALGVTLSRLCNGAAEIELDGTTWPMEKVQARLSGEEPSPGGEEQGDVPFSLTERGWARQLGLEPGEVRAKARQRWQGRTPDEELRWRRDVNPNVTEGEILRQLFDELRGAFDAP